ncbi:DUF2637 domain-containing protein, partial [Streptomyces megasporus]|uniref:DUF2637 domain-containing protein n=1 Tax=Streptomyces megasporus TaxID=44060 RepID=UPI0004E0C3EF
VAVEAARHAVGRIADITADKHMEGVRLSRWLLAFPSTFRLWRRMKLWELRSYDQVIRMEQDRLIYEARLRARYGRGWKRRAPVEALMPLRLARYGVPLAETAPAGLAAAGIEPGSGPRAVLPAGAPDGTGAGLALEKAPGETTDQAADQSTDQSTGAERSVEGVGAEGAAVEAPAAPAGRETPVLAPAAPAREPVARRSEVVPPEWEARPEPEPEVEPEPALRPEPANGAADGYGPAPEPAYAAASASPPTVPVSDGRHRPMGNPDARPAHVPSPREAAPPEPDDTVPVGIPDGMVYTEVYYRAYQQYIAVHGDRPNARQLAKVLYDEHGVTNAEGGLLSEGHLRMYLRDFKHRYNAEMGLAG